MNEPPPPRHDARPSRLRLLSAIVLGYLAAVGAFVVAGIVFAFVSKYGFGSLLPPVSNPTLGYEALSFLLALTSLYAFAAAVAMVPLTVLVLPIVWLVAYRLRANLLVTMILGAETGLLPALLVFRNDRGPEVFPYAAAAVAGAVFASVIWGMCVRPRLRAPAGTA